MYLSTDSPSLWDSTGGKKTALIMYAQQGFYPEPTCVFIRALSMFSTHCEVVCFRLCVPPTCFSFLPMWDTSLLQYFEPRRFLFYFIFYQSIITRSVWKTEEIQIMLDDLCLLLISLTLYILISGHHWLFLHIFICCP